MVDDIGVAELFEGFQGRVGTAAAAAVEVDGGLLVGADAADFCTDLPDRNINGALQVALAEFPGRAHIYPHAFGLEGLCRCRWDVGF